jgi:glycosyltransferase involved in cell wall biosynthesis
MSLSKIKIFHGFLEDHRASMEMYADNLAGGVRKFFSDEFDVSEFRPTIPNYLNIIPEQFHIKMQLARYLAYPIQVGKRNEPVLHITQPGYAHVPGREALARSIVTVHDIIPLLAWKGLIRGICSKKHPRLAAYSLSHLKYAYKIIAISENTKKDLVKYLGLPEENIKVIYFGIDDEFMRERISSKEELRHNLGLPGKETKIVLIAGREVHKNHLTCLHVMSILEKKYGKAIQMVKFGGAYPEWDDYIKEVDLKNDVISINECLDIARVADLYNCSDLLLFPSDYEGFGLPPVEAMACGLPVISSNAASLPEAVGSAALVSEADDIEGLAYNALRVLENEDLRATMIEKGFRNIRRFSWQKNVEETAMLYREISKKSEGQGIS